MTMEKALKILDGEYPDMKHTECQDDVYFVVAPEETGRRRRTSYQPIQNEDMGRGCEFTKQPTRGAKTALVADNENLRQPDADRATGRWSGSELREPRRRRPPKGRPGPHWPTRGNPIPIESGVGRIGGAPTMAIHSDGSGRPSDEQQIVRRYRPPGTIRTATNT